MSEQLDKLMKRGNDFLGTALPVIPVRALKNKGMVNFGELQLELLKKLDAGEIDRTQAQYEVEKYWIGSLKKAVKDGDIDFGSLMAGQSVGLVRDINPIKEIIREIMEDMEDEYEKVKSILC